MQLITAYIDVLLAGIPNQCRVAATADADGAGRALCIARLMKRLSITRSSMRTLASTSSTSTSASSAPRTANCNISVSLVMRGIYYAHVDKSSDLLFADELGLLENEMNHEKPGVAMLL